MLCKPISIIISIIIVGLILIITIICVIYRQNIFSKFELCKKYFSNSSSTKLNSSEEKQSFICDNNENSTHFIPFNQLTIGKLIKQGRFSEIYQGIYNDTNVACKILISKNLNDEPKSLFDHEKDIYSLPFMDHFNILKYSLFHWILFELFKILFRYYGYSICDKKLLLIYDLSEYGSLKDVLRNRQLNDENELLFIINQISLGLEYLHNEIENENKSNYRPSIAHRDFKSENILYLNSNRLVICDFGMSTKIEQNQNQPNQIQQVIYFLFLYLLLIF